GEVGAGVAASEVGGTVAPLLQFLTLSGREGRPLNVEIAFSPARGEMGRAQPTKAPAARKAKHRLNSGRRIQRAWVTLASIGPSTISEIQCGACGGSV